MAKNRLQELKRKADRRTFNLISLFKHPRGLTAANMVKKAHRLAYEIDFLNIVASELEEFGTLDGTRWENLSDREILTVAKEEQKEDKEMWDRL